MRIEREEEMRIKRKEDIRIKKVNGKYEDKREGDMRI